eukprot:TRINITY_DN23377_c0_g1_i2.p1 TRINITY_DN23377_c0_g1~~TRINITY_DN23377_c0_g1_i2.p1  ORF type:complete len:302 (-),score=61.39 TRINITY_DN23377_c0_g1_i2:136-984(-)
MLRSLVGSEMCIRDRCWSIRVGCLHRRLCVHALSEDGRWEGLGGERLLEVPRHEAAPAWFQGRLYLTGGRDREGSVLGTVESFDPSTGQWSHPLPSLKVARTGHSCTALGGSIYVCGGRNLAGIVHQSVEVLEPETGKWHFAAPVPTTVHSHKCVPCAGKLWLWDEHARRLEQHPVVHVFDPTVGYTGGWTSLTWQEAHEAAGVAEGWLEWLASQEEVVAGHPVIRGERLESASPLWTSTARVIQGLGHGTEQSFPWARQDWPSGSGSEPEDDRTSWLAGVS